MIEYVEVYEDGLMDFKSVILPHIFEQLLVTEDFDYENLRIFGALDEGIPVAALVIKFLPKKESYIESLYVKPSYRRQGIATTLMEAAITSSFKFFEHAIQIFFHTEYALPEEDFKTYESFIKKIGFRDFLEKNPSYYFEAKDLKTFDSPIENKNIKALTENFDEETKPLCEEYFDTQGLSLNPDYCFYTAEKGEADFFIAASYGGDENEFFIMSQDLIEEAKESDCQDAIKALINAVAKDHKDFTFILDGERNTHLNIWDSFLKTGGEKIQRSEAGMYIVLQQE